MDDELFVIVIVTSEALTTGTTIEPFSMLSNTRRRMTGAVFGVYLLGCGFGENKTKRKMFPIFVFSLLFFFFQDTCVTVKRGEQTRVTHESGDFF